MSQLPLIIFFFFFNDTATTEIYTLSLHDALPISARARLEGPVARVRVCIKVLDGNVDNSQSQTRSEEHTSELQSRPHLVCRLLLEKKKKNSEADEQQYELISTCMYRNTGHSDMSQ